MATLQPTLEKVLQVMPGIVLLFPSRTHDNAMQAILVRNVAAGIKGVDAAVLEAARGMGLSSRQILRDVELPLAMPVILAGVRVAVLSMIAIATVAAFFNAGGLGALIREGISQDYGDKIAAGVIAVALVAITFDQGLSALARASRRG